MINQYSILIIDFAINLEKLTNYPLSIMMYLGWSGDRGTNVSRKVRTSASEMPGNTRSGKAKLEDLLDRATEKILPEKVKVKRWCKRLPAISVMNRPGNPHLKQGQAETNLI